MKEKNGWQAGRLGSLKAKVPLMCRFMEVFGFLELGGFAAVSWALFVVG